MNETETQGIIYKVGDVVHSFLQFHGWESFTVARITATTAILSDGTKLRQGRRGGESAIGSSGWNHTRYYPDTPEVRERMTKDKNKTYAIGYKLAKFTERTGPSDDVIAKIVAIHKAAMVQINEILNEK